MNKFDKAAMMIGKYGTGAEADAIVKYLEYISAVVESGGMDNKLDVEIIENAKERISDEINHLLGDTLDAMRLADLYMSSDDIEKIFEGLKERVVGEDKPKSEKIVIPDKEGIVNYPVTHPPKNSTINL